MSLPAPILCLVTDRRATSPDARTTRDEITGLEAWLDQAIDAGITLIQLRERDLDARPLEQLARAVSARARESATRVVVNDRLDVALAAGADGVHLRGDAPPADRLRGLLPDGALVGRAIHAPEEARVHAGPVDYLLFGTVFPSASKPEGHQPAGVETLRLAVRAAAGLAPVMALGGITPARARACADAGASGLAGISLFLPRSVGGPADLRALVRTLRGAFAAVDDGVV